RHEERWQGQDERWHDDGYESPCPAVRPVPDEQRASDLGRKWTIEELARESGLSPSQFSRIFSKQYGEPPIQNLIHRRMNAAKQLVLESDLNIGEISQRVG
ncbi:MAG: helix-turn-helix transcriptional regulator, partial [Opitutales bacterium]|nr:helix-turn-helix transcriptional regulator [Opitutales bacterium]